MIHKEKRIQLIRTEEPEIILSSVPESKQMRKDIVAVKHTFSNYVTLSKLGFQVESPIKYYYDWPGPFPSPLEHQVKTAEFLTLYKRGFVLNGIGTGKTMAAVWAVDYLMQQGVIQKVLVLSPLSSLSPVWSKAIHSTLRLRAVELHGSKEERVKRLNQSADFYIINHDGVKVIEKELNSVKKKFDLIIVDEASILRNGQTDLYKSVVRILRHHKSRLWMITATPRPNKPTDVWSQVRLVNPNNVPKFFSQFRNQTMYQQSQFKWVEKPEANDIIYRVMQPSIRFSREECIDLPPTTYTDLFCDFTKEQEKHYKNMKKDFYTEFAAGGVSAVNEGVKRLKLLQIATGIVYGDDESVHVIDHSTRLNLLQDTIDKAPAKVIVFVPFTHILKTLQKELKGVSSEIIHGGVSYKSRVKIFDDFQKKDNPRVLLAHPKTMSHGLTLTESSTIIWYAPLDDGEVYEQANGRITRIGQTRKTMIIHLYSSEVERRIYKNLQQKKTMQGLLMEMLKSEEL